MYGARNQFFAGTRLPQYQYRGISRRYAFDLFQYRFQGCAMPDDLFESAFAGLREARTDYVRTCHRVPPGTTASTVRGFNPPERLERVRARPHRRTVWPGTPPLLRAKPVNAS